MNSYLDEAAFLKAKINNAGVLALGMCIFVPTQVSHLLIAAIQVTLRHSALVSKSHSVSPSTLTG
jgi:hypothetical protein